MELRHLRYFVAVAEKLSFTEAARLLHMAQPSLSLQIQDLEHHLNVTLFDRSNRYVRLTTAGEVFLAEARQLLERTELLIANTHRADQGELGELSVGFIYSAVQWFFPQVLRCFNQIKPGVSLQVCHLSTSAQEKALQERTIDIGLCRAHNQRAYPELTSQLLYQDELMVVVPQQHPLTQLPQITHADLGHYPFIPYARLESPTLFAAVMQSVGRLAVAPHTVQEPYMMENVLTLVEAGLGITLAYKAVSKMRAGQNLVFLPVENLNLPPLSLFALTRQEDTEKPIIRAFIDLLSQPHWYEQIQPSTSFCVNGQGTATSTLI